MPRIDKRRFFMVSALVSVAVFVLDIWFHGTFAAGIYEGYPMRPMAQIAALFPFLFATYIVQLTLFFLLFLKVYPERGLARAAAWGLWGGFFVVIPNMQFFVTVRDTTWTVLGIQVAEGIALMVLGTVMFEMAYRPRPIPTGNE